MTQSISLLPKNTKDYKKSDILERTEEEDNRSESKNASS
jgi:hypothetical protein